MTPQSSFMIDAVIRNGHLSPLREILQTLNRRPGLADPENALLPFGLFRQLHVARFTVLQANTNDDIRAFGEEPRPWPATLVFIGDVDGDADLFLAELCIRAGEGLRRIFSHCEGFEAGSADLLRWLRERNRVPQANYVNWRGRTVEQVHEEAALAAFVRRQLGEWQAAGAMPAAGTLHGELRDRVHEEVAALRLRLSPEAATPVGWWLRNLVHLVGVPLVLIVLSPLLVLLAPAYFLWLRRLENSDPENRARPTANHLRQLVEVEDFGVTNHFNVFGQVKPGLFRRTTLRVALLLLDYAARHVYRRGYLTRIQTIHFARWVLMDDGQRVYFASNYDGSADSYMDDFINKVAWGLNLVFSNGVGYPGTRWLLFGGARYEEKYKRTLRRNQLPSESWYKAYPGLTAVDLARNHRLRRGLERESLSDRELTEWMRLL
jgi:hypothetical protein